MALGVSLDLFGAIEKLIQFHKLNEWIKLYTSLICSFWLGGSFTTGVALTAHRPTIEAIGEGLILGTISTVATWRKSPLTKGMILSLPSEESKAEFEHTVDTIYK
jgi:uncharacterized membrane protein (DUF441 family)